MSSSRTRTVPSLKRQRTQTTHNNSGGRGRESDDLRQHAADRDWRSVRGAIVQATSTSDIENGTLFAPTLDEPVLALNELYEIVSVLELGRADRAGHQACSTLPTPERCSRSRLESSTGEKQARAAQVHAEQADARAAVPSRRPTTIRASEHLPACAEAEEAEDVAVGRRVEAGSAAPQGASPHARVLHIDL